MNGRDFSLVPFEGTGRVIPVEISGRIERRLAGLVIDYALRGDLGDVVLPPVAHMPSRQSGLWEGTCFELFLAVRDDHRYWEFNFSPAGHWNVYRFAAYREGMQEEGAFDSFHLSIRNEPGSLVLGAEVDVNRIVPPDQDLQVAVSAVIAHTSGGATYWALAHCGLQADFHLRDCFVIDL